MRVLAIGVAVVVAGCAGVADTLPSVQSRYIGQPASIFFARNGVPRASVAVPDGVVHHWVAGVVNYSMPSSTTVNATAYPGGMSGTAYSSGGGSIQIGCVLAIAADKSGRIVSIDVMRDSIGRFQPSRCAEVLAEVAGP